MKEQLFQSSCQKWSKPGVCIWLIFLSSFSIFAQDSFPVSIQIIDENKQPISGVVIQSQDKSYQEISNEVGQFIVFGMIPHLQLSFLGYETISLKWNQIVKNKFIIQLQPATLEMTEIVVLGRTDMEASQFHQTVDVIDQHKIALLNPQTSADALSQQANVFVQKSQMGGGSPVIRGFEANKVLLVVDGVRMNNAIYRSGHLQNAITVNSTLLDQIEVIYGPGSLMYGSDALGGVIHFRTREPNLSFQEINNEVNFFTRYASANQEKTGHVDFELGSEKWASLSSFTFSDFDDLRMGSNRTKKYPEYGKRSFWVTNEQGLDIVQNNPDPNLQIGTAYQQWDLMQKILFQPNTHLKQIFNFQYSGSGNIPRYDALNEWSAGQPVYAEWYYGPQNRFLASSKTRWSKKFAIWDQVSLLGAYQSIAEDRISRNFQTEWRQHQNEDVQVFSFNIDAQKSFDDQRKNYMEYGIEYIYNHLSSSAFAQNIHSESVNQAILTRYPNGKNKMSTYGIYALYTGHATSSDISWHSGLRFSGSEMSIQYKQGDGFTWPDNYYTGIQAKNQSLTWSAGVQLETKHKWTFGVTASSAFRSPNIDDFAKIRIKGSNATVPNVALDPEKSLNGELLAKKEIYNSGSKSFTIVTTAYYTHLFNAIVRQDFQLPNGSSTIIISGNEFNTQANVNATEAYIYGLSIQTVLNLKYWHFSASLNHIMGKIVEDPENHPLAHIPPLYGNLSLEYKLPKITLRTASRYNGVKPLNEYALDGTDNEQFATEEGALGWIIWDMQSEWKINNNLSIQVGLENILDKHYIPFSSGVSAPGRNLIITLRGNF